MKLRFAITFGIICLIAVCSCRPAEADYDYEEAAPAPAPAKPARPSLIGRRNPLTNRSNAKTTTTTTATPALKEEEEEVEEEPLEDEEEIPAQTSSTTEGGRKLKGGIVRPFRSNQDLLETLKKRREQAITNKQNAKTQNHEEENVPAAPEPEKTIAKNRPTSGGRKRFNAKDKQEAAASETKEEATPARTGRRFRN